MPDTIVTPYNRLMPDTIVTPYNRGPETVTIYLREGIVTVPALVESDEEGTTDPACSFHSPQIKFSYSSAQLHAISIDRFREILENNQIESVVRSLTGKRLMIHLARDAEELLDGRRIAQTVWLDEAEG